MRWSPSLEASPPMGTRASLSLAALRLPSPSRAALQWPSRASLRWPSPSRAALRRPSLSLAEMWLPSPWLRLWPVQLSPWPWPWRWPVGQRLQSPGVLRP